MVRMLHLCIVQQRGVRSLRVSECRMRGADAGRGRGELFGEVVGVREGRFGVGGGGAGEEVGVFGGWHLRL